MKIGTTTIKSFTYDEAGRTTRQTTSAGNTDYAFDEESRITGITFPNSTTSAYTYNGLDTRISKTENSATTSYRRMGAGVTAPVLSDGTNSFTPGISSRASSVSTWDFAGIKSNDSQVNSNGTIAATKTYDAFGNVVSNSGTWQGPFGYGGDYGYQSDEVSGLKLLGHRYYDSSIGRFLTRDPIKDGRNWYGYCKNNPTSAVDETGLYDKKVDGAIKRGIQREEVPPGSADRYRNDPAFRDRVHREIGKRKGRGGPLSNPDVSDEDIWESVHDALKAVPVPIPVRPPGNLGSPRPAYGPPAPINNPPAPRPGPDWGAIGIGAGIVIVGGIIIISSGGTLSGPVVAGASALGGVVIVGGSGKPKQGG